MLRTLLVPATLIVQLAGSKLWEVSDSVAVPGSAGLVESVAPALELVQTMPVLPLVELGNVALPVRLPVSVSPGFTLVPSAPPTTRTPPLAADVARGNPARADAIAAAIARDQYLRMDL